MIDCPTGPGTIHRVGTRADPEVPVCQAAPDERDDDQRAIRLIPEQRVTPEEHRFAGLAGRRVRDEQRPTAAETIGGTTGMSHPRRPRRGVPRAP